MLRGGIASVGAAVLLVLAGCGGGSKNAAVCGAQDAAAIQKRIEATGGQALLLRPPGNQNGDVSTRVAVERQPGFVALWVDAYCSPAVAARNSNIFKGIGALTRVIGAHVYVGLPSPETHSPQQPAAFNRFVSVSEDH